MTDVLFFRKKEWISNYPRNEIRYAAINQMINSEFWIHYKRIDKSKHDGLELYNMNIINVKNTWEVLKK